MLLLWEVGMSEGPPGEAGTGSLGRGKDQHEGRPWVELA